MTPQEARDYQHRYYIAHKERVLERQRERILRGVVRAAWQAKMAVPENRERERVRNLKRMRAKREPQRQASAWAKAKRLEALERSNAEKAERRANRPTPTEMRRANKHRYHVKHRKEINAHSRAWRLAHPDQFRDNVKKWHAAHPEQAREGVKRWVAAHPERRRAMGRRGDMKRRALHAKAFVEIVEPLVVYERDRGVCGICKCQIAAGQKWHVDHVEPLSKGGVHSYDNVQLAHAFCNVSKGAKLPKGQGDLLRRVG